MDHYIQTNDGKQIERLKKVIVEYNISEIEWVAFLFNNEVIAPKNIIRDKKGIFSTLLGGEILFQ